MSSHPNRSHAHGRACNPSADSVRSARDSVQLTQAQAAAMIHCAERSWQEWESGGRRMHPAFWELFQIKASVLLEQRNASSVPPAVSVPSQALSSLLQP